MPSVKIAIDGKTVMDGDLGQWTTEPPEILAEQLKANARPAPWMRALMMTLADAAVGSDQHGGEWSLRVAYDGQDTTIDVQTQEM